MAIGTKKAGTKAAGKKEAKKDITKTNNILSNIKVVRFTEFEKALSATTTMYGFATIDIGGVYINGVKVMSTEKDNDTKYWLSFPQEKGKDGNYYNVCGLASDIDADIVAAEVVAQINDK